MSLQSILTVAETQRARAVIEKKMGIRRTAKTEQAQFTTHLLTPTYNSK